MAEVSGTRNVVISLDVENARVKIMKILGQSPANSIIEYLPFDRELALRSEYGKMYRAGLEPYVKRANLKQVVFYLVLPDDVVSSWKITLPSFSRSKTEEALRAELVADLGDVKEYSVNTTQIGSSKKTNTFIASCVRKDIIKEIKTELGTLGIDPKTITFTSCGVSNAVLFLRQRARTGTYMLVDMRDKETTMALVSKEKMIESTSLPFGYEILRTDKYTEENELYPHDRAMVVVARAMETTTNALKNENGEFDDDVLYYDIDEAEKTLTPDELDAFTAQVDEAVKSALSESGETSEEQAKADAEAEKNFDAAENMQQTGEYTKPSGAASSSADMSVTGSFDTSTSIEIGSPKDMVERNFKNIHKRILLYCEAVKADPDLPDPEYIIMNFPKRFAFLLARANKDRSGSYEFKYFNPSIEDNSKFTENLDMFGALFTKVYNKTKIF